MPPRVVRSEARFFHQEHACLLLYLSPPSPDVLGRGARATISAILQIGKQRPILGQPAPVVEEALADQLRMKRNFSGRAFIFALWDIEHPSRADPVYVTRITTSHL